MQAVPLRQRPPSTSAGVAPPHPAVTWVGSGAQPQSAPAPPKPSASASCPCDRGVLCVPDPMAHVAAPQPRIQSPAAASRDVGTPAPPRSEPARENPSGFAAMGIPKRETRAPTGPAALRTPKTKRGPRGPPAALCTPQKRSGGPRRTPRSLAHLSASAGRHAVTQAEVYSVSWSRKMAGAPTAAHSALRAFGSPVPTSWKVENLPLQSRSALASAVYLATESVPVLLNEYWK